MTTGLPATGPLFVLLIAFSLLPVLALMTTSFVKIAVVLSLVRNALGVQQIPPNMALYAFAFILTLYVMTPVFLDALALVQHDPLPQDLPDAIAFLEKASQPFRHFLFLHASTQDIEFFQNLSKNIWEVYRDKTTHEFEQLIPQDNPTGEPPFSILIPAFMLTELTEAFEIGFLLYLPFIAVDLVVSNILLAMGMMMMSPMTISLPLKLLLFVIIDGWRRLIEGLILTYGVPA